MTSQRILVLGGGPDSEREVSLRSAAAIANALELAGYAVERQTIDRVSPDDLAVMRGDVIFPALHGQWGEGGPLQDILESDGRPFVGSFSRPARVAMDKVATKFVAVQQGVATPRVHLLDARDSVCPVPLPVVIKPVHDGSTVGLHLLREDPDWARARGVILEEQAADPTRLYMIEPMITGETDGGSLIGTTPKRARELTVGVLDGVAMPAIEITPAIELYDYQAKYNRNDTRYQVAPALPVGVTERIQRQTESIAGAIGLRHVARADFMLDGTGTAWFLEINSMPGFTDHSLVPMAARHMGLEMPELCSRLVAMACRDHASEARCTSPARRD
jgi:D-alanine-D-alanine ligase